MKFSHIFPQGLGAVRKRLPELIEQLDVDLAEVMWGQYGELCQLDARVKAVTEQLLRMAEPSSSCRRLMRLPGDLADHRGRADGALPQAYRNGRNYLTVLGLVPLSQSRRCKPDCDPAPGMDFA